MTGLDYKRASLGIREDFALTKEKTRQILMAVKENGATGGYVIISTCNRTEFYASIPDGECFLPSKTLCAALGVDFIEYEPYFTERIGDCVMEHLCRTASGLESQIMGDDQIITQVREALELSREQNCADSYLETIFRLSIQAAKVIKTNILSNSLKNSSVPGKMVEKLKAMCPLAGRNAVVIGSGRIGRAVAELLIRENVNVTVTLRTHKKGDLQTPDKADTISYGERYQAIEKADIVVSATTSPHLTISLHEMSALKQWPKLFIDLAVPRDIESSVRDLDGITLLTIDDISGGDRALPPESVAMIESIIEEHISKYRQWLAFKTTAQTQTAFFPLFVDLNGKKALVAGGGNVAERRIKVLLAFGTDITVISPNATEYIEDAAERGAICLFKRKYAEGDAGGLMPFLVIAATDDRQVNHAIMTEARSLNIQVSVADCREECTCYFPAIAENDAYIAALVSKNGDHCGVKQMAHNIKGLIDS
jgi:glutamyl-tRNA reductase